MTSPQSIAWPLFCSTNKIQASKWEQVLRGLNEWHLLVVWTPIIASQRNSLAAKLGSPFILLTAVEGGTKHLWSFLYSSSSLQALGRKTQLGQAGGSSWENPAEEDSSEVRNGFFRESPSFYFHSSVWRLKPHRWWVLNKVWSTCLKIQQRGLYILKTWEFWFSWKFWFSNSSHVFKESF